MKMSRLTIRICGMGMFLLAAAVMAQDSDKQKLIDVEKAFAANATPGPEAAAVATHAPERSPQL